MGTNGPYHVPLICNAYFYLGCCFSNRRLFSSIQILYWRLCRHCHRLHWFGDLNFLLALVLMYIGVVHFGTDVGGLFSSEYKNAPWSWEKFWNLLEHLWLPVFVLGTSATASLIRIMRANLLDELSKPYVDTARAKGLSEFWLIIKYPVRVALNPFISTIGWVLPNLVSGAVVTAIVLSLPTAGPLMLQALLSQDMYLAGHLYCFYHH